MKILCIGSITKDIFFPTGEGVILETPNDILSQKKIAFELGAKYHIQDRHETLGGCPVNVACGLVKLGEEGVGCYVPIGDDATGKWTKQELSLQGVDISKFTMIPGIYSDLSAIVVDMASGERTIFSSHSASEKFEIDQNNIGNPEWIFVGDLSGQWKKNLDLILSVAKKNNIPLVFNPRQKTIHDDVQKNSEAIALCEILFVNKDEAMEIISLANGLQDKKLLNDERYLIMELKKIGAKTVIITDGIRGAWGYDGEQFLHVDALVREATDTTGAGDAFASGFLAARLKGKDLAEALQWGIINSSNSVTEYGGQKGLLTQKDVKSMALQVDVKELS